MTSTALKSSYEKYVWRKKKGGGIQQNATGKRTGAYLGINKCNHENNGIFLLHLALHEPSRRQADAATKLYLPMPCNQQDQVVALIYPYLQDQKARHSLLHRQVPQNGGRKLTCKA